MTNIDQFESVFRSADKAVYAHHPVGIHKVLVVTDLESDAAHELTATVRQFLSKIDGEGVEWMAIAGSDFDSVQSLLDLVEKNQPDLVVTYRHLQSTAWQWPFSLGEHLDVLTQATSTPILVLPHPDAGHHLPHSVQDTDKVMAITDHLTGDNRLVDYAVGFTADGGACWLTHVEGVDQFERYMDAIAKLPSINTDLARDVIAEQLLKEPADFIQSCRTVIDGHRITINIEQLVVMGRRLEEYKSLVEDHEIDLLIMNTKDGDQLAMHGLAYPLAVEMRGIPLLLL